MAAKNDNITKDPVAAAKKGAKTRKGRRHRLTIIKEKLEQQGFKWENVEDIVEQNMVEFLTSPLKKERLQATRYFSEFVKPKKKDISGNLKVGIEDLIEDDNEC